MSLPKRFTPSACLVCRGDLFPNKSGARPLVHGTPRGWTGDGPRGPARPCGALLRQANLAGLTVDAYLEQTGTPRPSRIDDPRPVGSARNPITRGERASSAAGTVGAAAPSPAATPILRRDSAPVYIQGPSIPTPADRLPVPPSDDVPSAPLSTFAEALAAGAAAFADEPGDPFPEVAEALDGRREAERAALEDLGVEQPEESDETGDLRAVIDRQAKQLHAAKVKKAQLVAAVYRAASDSMAGRPAVIVPAPRPHDAGPHSPQVAVVVVSDLQLGKRTPEYDSATCARRIEILAERVVSIVRLHRHLHPVDELHVWLLGDIVEGELIFPGQSHLIDAGLYRQVTVSAQDILGGLIRAMLAEFQTVKVFGVIGNHGSMGGPARREYSPETNADRMVYRILEREFRSEPRASFVIPDGLHERNWYAIDKIGNRSFLLTHGDAFRWGVKTPSTEGKILGWKAGAIPEDFDEVVVGHFHNVNLISLRGGTIDLRVNGSTESFNTYAQETLGSMARPCQWLLFVHPTKPARRAVTAEYRVWLDEDEGPR